MFRLAKKERVQILRREWKKKKGKRKVLEGGELERKEGERTKGEGLSVLFQRRNRELLKVSFE